VPAVLVVVKRKSRVFFEKAGYLTIDRPHPQYRRTGTRAVLVCTAARQWRTSMSVNTVQMGSARATDEGLRIGTVRRPPRKAGTAFFACINPTDADSGGDGESLRTDC
jgi:hypothetical protein